MSIWQQNYFSTQDFLPKGNHLQQYNFEILNFTSLNFARPNTTTDSHTASMTAERRKLFDQLPRLNTYDHKKCKSLDVAAADATTTLNNNNSLKKIQTKNDDVTRNGARVKLVHDVAAIPDDSNNEIKENDNLNHDNEKKKNRNWKSIRRASAPAKGIDYYFKNAKPERNNNEILNYFNKLKNEDSTINEIHEEPEDKEVQMNQMNHHHDYSKDSVIPSSIVVPENSCPSLTPCSSTSSLSSSVDMLSPAKQSFNPQQYANGNFWSIKQKSKTLPTEKNESHSLPDDPYNNVPWSPAVSFLSSLVSLPVKKSLPDDEGQQIREYIIGKVIGRGGFSTVKQAYTIDNFSGSMEVVAVKIVKNYIDNENNDRVQALLEREITIWRELNHPNIVPMLSYEETDYATFIFSEYCPGGTLLDYIKKHCKCEGKGLDEDEARNIFLEIAEAIRYLHNDMRLVHKDIKLDNILLDKDDNWKICDFGLTEFQNPANGFNNVLYNSVGGSVAYCSPEQLRSPTPLKDPSSDIWSLGVVLYAMLVGQLPFCDSFEPRLQFKIINGRYDESLLVDSGVSNELIDLLKGMFKTKPDQRLTISQIMEHPWCER